MNRSYRNISFLSAFSSLPDPRIERSKLYPLNEVLLLALCACICGAESWNEIVAFGNDHLSYLKRILPYENGIPSHDTVSRVFRLLNPQAFEKCFRLWMKGFLKKIPKIINIDGKTVRRSFDKKSDKKAIHMVSAFASDYRFVLAQTKVDEKSNEITAIPTLLNVLEVAGAIVTIDAMGCQTEIAKQIREKKGDYILALKGNHGNLHDDVRIYFETESKTQFGEVNVKVSQEHDKGHGRIESRTCYVTEDIDWLPQKAKWAGLNSIIRIESVIIRNNKECQESRYYISSLPADPELINSSIRKHWAIENSLHWVLDVTMREDDSRIRADYSAENLSLIRKWALNYLQKSKGEKMSIKRLRKKAGWNEEALTKILTEEIVND